MSTASEGWADTSLAGNGCADWRGEIYTEQLCAVHDSKPKMMAPEGEIERLLMGGSEETVYANQHNAHATDQHLTECFKLHVYMYASLRRIIFIMIMQIVASVSIPGIRP